MIVGIRRAFEGTEWISSNEPPYQLSDGRDRAVAGLVGASLAVSIHFVARVNPAQAAAGCRL